MNTADTFIPSSRFKTLAQYPCVGKGVLHNSSEVIEAKMDQVVVLGNDLGIKLREVEREGLFSSPLDGEIQNQMLWEVLLVTTNDPAWANVDKAKLVSGRVD